MTRFVCRLRRYARLRGLLANTCFIVVAAARLDAAGEGDPGAELYRASSEQTRWASFENQNGTKGGGGLENQGAKGDPEQEVKPGEAKVLLNVKGSGTIRRIWMTMMDKSPKMLNGFRLDIYWDEAKTPAVSAPLGSFFGQCAGGMTRFESEFFSSPEGRSFNCYIPMPFRKAARVVVRNETETVQRCLFYDIDYTLCKKQPNNALYFHTTWHRQNPTQLGRDFEILPRVMGRGRFLGANVTVAAIDPYGIGEEGAVKIYLDGDTTHATLVGTGTEDYIGDGWGAGVFAHRYQGCLAARDGFLAFYRYHVLDPVYFQSDCRVTIQQMFGGSKEDVIKMAQAGRQLQVVGGDFGQGRITGLLDAHPGIKPQEAPEGFVYAYASLDLTATAYFYLDKPENNLPPLAGFAERNAGSPSPR
jgi:hypothetical protein